MIYEIDLRIIGERSTWTVYVEADSIEEAMIAALKNEGNDLDLVVASAKETEIIELIHAKVRA